MSLKQLQARLRGLESEAAGLYDKSTNGRLSTTEQSRLAILEEEIAKVEGDVREAKKARLAEIVADPSRRQTVGFVNDAPNYNRGGNPFHDPGRETPEQTRSRARAAIEQWNADDELKESATATIDSAGRDAADDAQAMRDVSGVAAHVIRFSDPLYVSAFRKYARDPETYQADLTSAEAEAWRQARYEARATLDLTGAVLPSPLDPTIVLTNDGTIDPMRGIARVDSTISKSKRYITSAGSTFSYDAELAEVSDDTPTLTEVEINTHKAQGWIEASIEAAADQPDFSSEVARIIADGKARLEGDKWVTGAGDGSNEPFGIETQLDGGASEVAPATAETFAAEDVYATLEAVPPRFRGRARFMAELSTLNEMDQFETTNGAKLFGNLGDANPTLLRRGVSENSNVDAFADVDTGADADNFILYAGDFRNYIILDRIGLSVHFIPPGVLVGASGRPDGRVGWYAYWRNGADVLDIAAFRVLNLATAAV